MSSHQLARLTTPHQRRVRRKPCLADKRRSNAFDTNSLLIAPLKNAGIPVSAIYVAISFMTIMMYTVLEST
jgi:hypothetical protein